MLTRNSLGMTTANSISNFVRDAIASRTETIHAQINGVRSQEVDAVHDMRVASRRLRAALKLFGRVLRTEAEETLTDNARAITRLLGRPRELDVMLDMLAQERERAIGPWREAIERATSAIREQRNAAAHACDEAARLAESLALPEDAIDPHRAHTIGGLNAFRDVRLARAHKRLRKAHRAWHHDPDGETLHSLRIAFKKYRYTCELFLPIAPDLAPHVESLKAVQQSLGDWNDCRVLVNELEALKLHTPSADAQALLRLAFKNRADEHLRAFSLQAVPFFKEFAPPA